MDDIKQKYGAAIGLMSPTTLASFLSDVADSTVLGEQERDDLTDLLRAELIAICGDEEAAELITLAS